MKAYNSAWIEEILDNVTKNYDPSLAMNDNESEMKVSPTSIFITKWALRISCLFITIACPWANYKLIQLFHTRRFHKESSAKWYITFKATFDIGYVLVSLPIIFCLTFDIDIIHRNVFTCKLITYFHYLADDLISILLLLLCIDRMLRITCGVRFRQRFSLFICITTVILFAIINIHHIVRLQHRNGFCHKAYLSIWDYDFDIYYSFLLTCITWSIILIASINLTVSVYCDRARRLKLVKTERQQKQQQNISKILLNNDNDSLGLDNDRVELIENTDDIEDVTAVIIEPNSSPNGSWDKEQQDNVDLQITVCVLIISAIFLGCNLPNFIIFILRFVSNLRFSTIGYIFVYISIFPLLVAHTITYFIFNHLAARIFPVSS